MVDDCNIMLNVVKTFKDRRLIFLTCYLLGALYINLELPEQARKIFDLMKDLAEEAINLGQTI